MSLLDPKNGPEFDLPDCGEVRTYAVASLPRTGSTLLCRGLWDTGLCGAPKEYLNPMQLRDWGLRAGRRRYRLLVGPLQVLARGDVERHLAEVRARRSSNGWFGLKIHRHHHERFRGALQVDRWILITRRDRLAQAVSWARAIQTGRWADWQKGLLPPVYSRSRIQRCLEQIHRDEAAWRQELGEVHEVVYEELVADFPGVLAATLGHLGLEATALPAPGMTRQADEVSAAWVERFRSGS